MPLRRALHWMGSAGALAGAVFVALRLAQHWNSQDFSSISSAAWAGVAGLAVLYGASNMLLALSWAHILRQCKARVTRTWAMRAYGLSQLAKYVPGNVFHLVSRQALGMSAGVPAGALAKSSLWDLGLIALAAVPFGWLAAPLAAPIVPPWAGVACSLATAMAISQYLVWLGRPHAAAAFRLSALFHCASAAIFVILLQTIVMREADEAGSWLLVGAAYVIAWMAGFVTPGAPAGLGIRELVLLLLLRNTVADAHVVAAVVLGRAVTITGDLLFFCASFSISGRKALLNTHE